MSVIPDSIEPVIGWKRLQLQGDVLRSQAHAMYWPHGERAVAQCPGGRRWVRQWEADTHPDGSEIDPATEGIAQTATGYYGPGVSMSAAVALFSTAPAVPESIEPPKVELPSNLRWHYRQREVIHEAPGDGCSCGIYLAADEAATRHYGDILLKVAGWGKVVEHSAGWRVQYAYPTEIYVNKKQASLLSAYGVPLILDKEPISSMPRQLGFIFTNEGASGTATDIALAAAIGANAAAVLGRPGYISLVNIAAIAAIVAAAFAIGRLSRRCS